MLVRTNFISYYDVFLPQYPIFSNVVQRIKDQNGLSRFLYLTLSTPFETNDPNLNCHSSVALKNTAPVRFFAFTW